MPFIKILKNIFATFTVGVLQNSPAGVYNFGVICSTV